QGRHVSRSALHQHHLDVEIVFGKYSLALSDPTGAECCGGRSIGDDKFRRLSIGQMKIRNCPNGEQNNCDFSDHEINLASEGWHRKMQNHGTETLCHPTDYCLMVQARVDRRALVIVCDKDVTRSKHHPIASKVRASLV